MKLKIFLFLLLLLPNFSNAETSISEFNPISHWSLNEVSGVRYDSSTSSNDLTDNNTVGSASGLLDLAADVEHGNTEYFSITDAAQIGLEINSSFTFNVWANLESLPSSSGTYYGLLGKYSSTGGRSYAFYFDDANKLKLDVSQTSNGSTRRYSVATNVTITSGELGTWHMYTAVFDMPTATITLYKDASSIALTTNNAGTLTSIYDSSLPFTLAQANQAGNQTFDGLLDEITVLNYPLSSTQITTFFNSGTPLPFDPVENVGANICVYANVPYMNGTTGQVCVVDGATTTCEYQISTTTVPVIVNSQDIVFALAVIVFLLAFLWFGYMFAAFKNKTK